MKKGFLVSNTEKRETRRKKTKQDTWNKGFLLSSKRRSDATSTIRSSSPTHDNNNKNNNKNNNENSLQKRNENGERNRLTADQDENDSSILHPKITPLLTTVIHDKDTKEIHKDATMEDHPPNDKPCWKKGFLLSDTNTTTKRTNNRNPINTIKEQNTKKKNSINTTQTKKTISTCSDLLLSFENDENDSNHNNNNHLFQIPFMDDENNYKKSSNQPKDTLEKPNLILPLKEDSSSFNNNDDWMLRPIQTKHTTIQSEPASNSSQQPQAPQQQDGNNEHVREMNHLLGQWTRSYEQRPHNKRLSHVIFKWMDSNIRRKTISWIEIIVCQSNLLRSIASHAKDNRLQLSSSENHWWCHLPPCLQLGCMLLHTHTEKMCQFLCSQLQPHIFPSSNKQIDKFQQLGAAVLWRLFFQNDTTTYNHTTSLGLCQSFLLPQALPSLVQILLTSSSKKPTLLQVSCMDATLSTYHYVANAWHHNYTTADSNEDDMVLELSKAILWDSCRPWQSLMDILQKWASVKEQKYRLRPCIIEDWKRLLQLHPVADPSDPHDIQLCTFQVCQSILGTSPLGGGLMTTLCYLPVTSREQQKMMSPEEAYLILETAQTLLTSSSSSSSKNQLDTMTQACTVLRGFASWLEKRKHKQPTTTADWNRRVIQTCIYLLRFNHPTQTIPLIMAILDYFWDNHSMMFTTTTTTTEFQMDSPFDMLLHQLQTNESDIQMEDKSNDRLDLEPSTKALCRLASRYILQSPSKKAMLQKVLNRTSRFGCVSTVEILISVLQSLSSSAHFSENNKYRNPMENEKHHDKHVNNESQNPSYSDEHEFDKEIQIQVLDFIHDYLLLILDTNKYFQRILNQNPTLLSKASIQKTIPRFSSILFLSKTSPKLASAVSASLSDVIVTNSVTQSKAETCVNILLDATKSHVGPNEENTETIMRFFLKYAPIWRRNLLFHSPGYSDNGYRNIVVSIAKAMFKDPSSSICLPFFGAIIDNNESQQSSSEIDCLLKKHQMKLRIQNATWGLLCIGLDQIQAVFTDSNKQEVKNPRIIFQRLAPLLMFRRIPYFNFRLFYHDVKNEHWSNINEFNKVISVSLGIVNDDSCTISLSRDERRLATEIFVRSFPFSAGWMEHCSSSSELHFCFDHLCKPTFRKTLDEFHHKSLPDCSPLDVDLIQRAKTSLYAVCHYISIASDDDDGECLMIAFDFAMEILAVNMDDESLLQLQTGCIDTIAICLASYCTRRLKTKVQPRNSSSNPLVKEIFPEKIENAKMRQTTRKMKRNILNTSSIIFAQTIDIAIGTPHDQSLKPNKYHNASVSTRTCLFNSLIVASQKCMVDDGGLNLFTSLTTPKILQWYLNMKDEKSDLYHPLCLAAVLHIFFVIVTRTKSFDCFAMKGRAVKKDDVINIFRFTLKLVKHPSADSESIGLVRMKALKVILSIVSIDQLYYYDNNMNGSENIGNFLSPRELSEAYSIVKGAANLDESVEVQKLATTILSAIQVF